MTHSKKTKNEKTQKDEEKYERSEDTGEVGCDDDDRVQWNITRTVKSEAVITKISITKTQPKQKAVPQQQNVYNEASTFWKFENNARQTPGPPTNHYNFGTPYNSPNIDYGNMFMPGTQYAPPPPPPPSSSPTYTGYPSRSSSFQLNYPVYYYGQRQPPAPQTQTPLQPQPQPQPQQMYPNNYNGARY